MYRTAAFVEACLDSTIAAGRDGIEYVLVDDGSPDDCAARAAAWLRRRGAAGVVLSQANAGLSVARNTGLSQARGRWVAFLDSDDLFSGVTYRRMVAAGDAHGADLVMAHSLCMNADTLGVYGFPGWDVWAAVIGNSAIRRTTLAREPRLLRLEPSATTRLYRRSFTERIALAYPPGLKYEDIPTHVRGIARAGIVVLLPETGLIYRVGRPGQITAERGTGRRDIVDICRLAVQEARDAGISDEAGAWLMGSLARSIIWCARYTAATDRRALLADAAAAVAQAPRAWIESYTAHLAGSTEERLLGAALSIGDAGLLEILAAGGMPRFRDLYRRARYHPALRAIAWSQGCGIAASTWRRITFRGGTG